MTGSFERFDGSRDSMTHYFEVTRARAIEREWEISTDFDEGVLGLGPISWRRSIRIHRVWIPITQALGLTVIRWIE